MSVKETRGLSIVKEIRENIFIDEQAAPSSIIKTMWTHYKEHYPENVSVNGAVFEEMIGYVLTVKGCAPFYMQAKVAYVPNVNYDFILYDTEIGPISLSAKTTLRERWKQADLEAFVLKNVHRDSLSYAVTLDAAEAAARNARIKDCLGLNSFILATSEQFDQLIGYLQQRTLVIAGQVKIVVSEKAFDQELGNIRYGISDYL